MLLDYRKIQFDLQVRRPSFTLIELLVSIAIIGVMASMVLYTLAGAQTDAKRSRTRVTIEKINAVILEKWESYRYRSVKLAIPQSFTRLQRNASGVGQAIVTPRDAARLRAVLLRDLIRMEMPDRQSDLLYSPINAVFTSTFDSATYSLDSFGGRYPSREFNVLRNNFNLASVPGPYSGPVSTNANAFSAIGNTWTEANQASECLYAIVAHASTGFGSALEGFHPSEIGDTDEDGYPEFIDAWGNPIGWIRWPASLPSTLNLSYKGTDPAAPISPDAFDPFKTDLHWGGTYVQKPWTLVPLVFSSGPDGQFGVANPNVAFANLTDNPNRSMFIPSTDAPVVGQMTNEFEFADNISNHDLLLE